MIYFYQTNGLASSRRDVDVELIEHEPLPVSTSLLREEMRIGAMGSWLVGVIEDALMSAGEIVKK